MFRQTGMSRWKYYFYAQRDELKNRLLAKQLAILFRNNNEAQWTYQQLAERFKTNICKLAEIVVDRFTETLELKHPCGMAVKSSSGEIANHFGRFASQTIFAFREDLTEPPQVMIGPDHSGACYQFMVGKKQ